MGADGERDLVHARVHAFRAALDAAQSFPPKTIILLVVVVPLREPRLVLFRAVLLPVRARALPAPVRGAAWRGFRRVVVGLRPRLGLGAVLLLASRPSLRVSVPLPPEPGSGLPRLRAHPLPLLPSPPFVVALHLLVHPAVRSLRPAPRLGLVIRSPHVVVRSRLLVVVPIRGFGGIEVGVVAFLRVHAALQDSHAPRPRGVDGLHHVLGLLLAVEVLVRVPLDGHPFERLGDVVRRGGGFVQAQGLERVRGLGRLVPFRGFLVSRTPGPPDVLGPLVARVVAEPRVGIPAPPPVVRLGGGKQLRERRDEDDGDDGEDAVQPVPQLHHRVTLGVPNPAAPPPSPLLRGELLVQRQDLVLAHAGAVELAGARVEAAGHAGVAGAGAARGLLAPTLPRLDAHLGREPRLPARPRE